MLIGIVQPRGIGDHAAKGGEVELGASRDEISRRREEGIDDVDNPVALLKLPF